LHLHSLLHALSRLLFCVCCFAFVVALLRSSCTHSRGLKKFSLPSLHYNSPCERFYEMKSTLQVYFSPNAWDSALCSLAVILFQHRSIFSHDLLFHSNENFSSLNLSLTKFSNGRNDYKHHVTRTNTSCYTNASTILTPRLSPFLTLNTYTPHPHWSMGCHQRILVSLPLFHSLIVTMT